MLSSNESSRASSAFGVYPPYYWHFVDAVWIVIFIVVCLLDERSLQQTATDVRAPE
jgi:heme/copper-type cytochrome/quinol oxidase subunit 3